MSDNPIHFFIIDACYECGANKCPMCMHCHYCTGEMCEEVWEEHQKEITKLSAQGYTVTSNWRKHPTWKRAKEREQFTFS